MTITLDHILWATPDLARGCDTFAQLTGVTAAPGGAHPGFGTRNALSSFSPTTYLEILAPDPDQDLTGTWGLDVAALSQSCMYSFALACDDLNTAAARARAAGVTVADPIAMSRKTPQGDELHWRIMRLSDPRWPGRLPFFIDWQDTIHPGQTTPGGCTMTDLYALDPDPLALKAIYSAIGSDMPVMGGVAHGFLARLNTPKGIVVLT